MVQWLASHFVVRNYDRMASVGAILDGLGWKSLQSRRRAMRLYMLYKIHYGHVEADGMQQPIPMRQDSIHLNSNTYAVPYSRTKYQKYSFFSTHNKGMELITRRYCHPAELGLLKKKHYLNDCIPLCVLIN